MAWVPNFTLQFLSRRFRADESATLDLSSLRTLINCSEPVRASGMDEFYRVYKDFKLQRGVLHSSYAMAETVFAVTQSDATSDGPSRVWLDAEVFRRRKYASPTNANAPGSTCFVSSGVCLPDTEVRIIGDDQKILEMGFVGEILIKSTTLFPGYFNRHDLSLEVLRDGWYRSGDLGFLLDDELYVIGRKKDLIIVAGENIYPQDIEEIVSAHSAIYDGRAVAFGQFNPQLGTEEVVVVAEVRKREDLQRDLAIDRELRAAITAEFPVRLGTIYLKPPRWVVKSTAGKPARSTTREKLIAEHPELQILEGAN